MQNYFYSFIYYISSILKMYTIDITKHELSRSINNQQRQLNHSNSNRQRENRPDLLQPSSSKKRVRNSTEHKVYLHRNLADIQKQQIQLKKLDVANDLIKSRIQDEENLLNLNERFPYGKENVGISEDVLERYRGNYLEQSKILEKFRIEAELMRKTARIKGAKGKSVQWAYRQNAENRRKQLQLQRMRQTIQKQYEEERLMRDLEKKNMKSIVQTLSGLSLQLHNNSYTLQRGIRDLHTQLKRSQPPPNFPEKPKHVPKDILDLQEYSKRVPVVVYKNTPFDARLYFSDVFKSARKVKKQDISNVNKEQYKYLMNVLQENNKRLGYLDKLGQWERSDDFSQIED